MQENFNLKMILNSNYIDVEKKSPENFCDEKLENVRRFISTIPECSPSPFIRLKGLADYLGVKEVFIKDEGKRCYLNSFKILGASFAISKCICEKLNININEINFNFLKSNEVRKKIQNLVFTTCSDGNHGRAVAWTAKELGVKAVIYLNKGTSYDRVKAIQDLGAEAVVTNFNYDDTVRYANEKAEENGWIVVQDTSWDGYEKIPTWIMQGYSTMGYEAIKSLKEKNVNPTHIFLQAGVGAMAGGVLGCISNMYKLNPPKTIIVEPLNAACMYNSASYNDGDIHIVKGNLESIMAGLACGEPVKEGWNILRDYAYAFIKCSDEVTARGMRILSSPLKNDKRVVSGESGAVTLGVLSFLMKEDKLIELKKMLGLDESSVVLLFSTEGATDPVNYKQIVWGGKFFSV